ncbi:MAG: small multidrug resistance protein [Akkermansiaceae bacterium]|nr:small multidrug resistance protein [Armatimonadota bacterium]
MSSLLLAVLSAVCFTIGGVFMKHSDGLTKLAPTLTVFALFLVGACFNILLMKREDLGVAYVFVLGLEAVLAFLLGIWIFKEPVLLPRVLGVVLIVGGILLLKSGEETKEESNLESRTAGSAQ